MGHLAALVRSRILALFVVALAFSWAVDRPFAADTKKQAPKKLQRITPAERKAAAKRARATGLKPGVAGAPARAGARVVPQAGARTGAAALAAAPLPGVDGPGGVPHYFGPYGNWAYSPLPTGPIAAVTVVDEGSGYTDPVVTIDDAYGTATAPAAVTASVDPTTGAITELTIVSGGAGYSAPVVTITDPTGEGATGDATIGGALAGGMRKFVDRLPGLGPAEANGLGQYLPVASPQGWPLGCAPPDCRADYYEIALVEFTERMHSDLPPTRLRGYVQLSTTAGAGVPLFQVDGVTPILKPDGTQAYGVDRPHSLGPVIVAKGRAHGVPGPAGQAFPVRIKFYNLLPAGAGGDLFLPVDETVPGAGVGPSLPGTAGDKFTQNRATIHLHGNNTVWISDGNTHQWITPADENTPYPRGASVRVVPDMLDVNGALECDVAPPGRTSSGCLTFYYTNAQSARLQFYHDHAMGITRLGVYAGGAAGYVITDAVEQDLIDGTNVSGANPGGLKVLPGLGIPLVIQDRTWVDASTIFAQDPTWNWGTGARDPATGRIAGAVTGDLWYPHVYMSAQNPWDLEGVNGFGRWHYGPWFNPPVPECVDGGPVGCIELGPVPNEYHQPVCDGLPDPVNPVCTAPWEPPLRPGVPNPSIPGEGFMDTPIVNGTAYPFLEVEPRAYRFRILNGANDRMFNLQLYVAADRDSWAPSSSPAVPGTPTALCPAGAPDPTVCTEVKMISTAGQPNQYADWPSGIPDPKTKGPDWILIGTEGGFMPKPIVVPQKPVGWNLNPTTFNFGVVNQHALLVGSAERADVVVDFSAYAGKTLILYNDAPAAFPAGAPSYDYYTGSPNQMDGGGAPTTQPGYGPNTRTVMQIRVTRPLATPTPDVTLANLQAVFAKTATKRGVFELTQDPIIIPQAAYNSAYDRTFPSTAAAQYVQIADTAKTFQPIDETGALQPAVTLPLELKAMHDEMGGVYDTLFGRMSGMLGLSLLNSPNHVLIPYGYSSPPTDVVKGSIEGSPIGVMPDGTQLWRIFHNGVDTHTIHTHLFHAQLINRLGQDGLQLQVDPIELGWKDTFRVNPLEITYLALRPTVPTPDVLPFEVPDSVRLIDPTLPEAASLIPPPPAGWFDPAGNFIPDILNHYVNFGWEYVWHCHILAHEEMDMMHSLVFAVPPLAPTGLALASVGGTPTAPLVNLTWSDNSLKEVQFTIQRANDASFATGLRTVNFANPTPTTTGPVAFQDASVAPNARYWYRVFAIGAPVGDGFTPGFPTLSTDSVSNTIEVVVGTPPTGVPANPTLLRTTLTFGPLVTLNWRDNATNETGFIVERCTVAPPAADCADFAQLTVRPPRNNTGGVSYPDFTVTPGKTFFYRVWAVNASGRSTAPSNATSVVVPAIPAPPASFTVTVVKNATGPNYTATLSWGPYSPNPSDFSIQRARNAAFTTGLNEVVVPGAARTRTQTLAPNTTYYYRIHADSDITPSSAWKNALPFPVRTGP